MKLHDYQKYAVRFIEEHPIAALFLDMGLGKTITTLTAIHNLMFDLFAVRKVLMIAPLRVARDTWSAEIEKWENLKPLQYSVAVGTEEERLAALNAPADIYIINRENIDWLVNNTKFDYDMVVIDELSSFKSHQSKRFKALMKVRPNVKRIVGLTGTPASNGLMDLWSESVCWIWDSGSADSSGSTGMPTSSPTSRTAISCIPTSPCPMQSGRFMRKLLTSPFR